MAQKSIRDRRLTTMSRERRGLGEGKNYVSGASVWEDHLAKRVHRIPFMGRQAHLARDSLFAAFLWECYQDKTEDIRELFPCEATPELAGRLKIRHPKYPDGSDKVLKTDLLVTKSSGKKRWLEAISVRLERDGRPPVGIAELQIIEAYWTERGVNWSLSLNSGLNSNWARNLDFLYAIALQPVRAGDGADEPEVQNAVIRALQRGKHTTVRQACEFAMRAEGLPVRYGLNALHLLLAAKSIRFDVHCREIDSEEVSRFAIRSEKLISLR
jgi:hypothetical protein